VCPRIAMLALGLGCELRLECEYGLVLPRWLNFVLDGNHKIVCQCGAVMPCARGQELRAKGWRLGG